MTPLWGELAGDPQFIMVHRADNYSSPVVLNTSHIIAVWPLDNDGAVIHIADLVFEVEETFHCITEKIGSVA